VPPQGVRLSRERGGTNGNWSGSAQTRHLEMIISASWRCHARLNPETSEASHCFTFFQLAPLKSAVACRSPHENPFRQQQAAADSSRPVLVRADLLSRGCRRLGRSEECAAARRELSFILDHADRDAIDIRNLGAAKAKRIARAGLLLVGGVGPACRRQHRNRERGCEHRTELKPSGTNDEHESPRGVDARIVGERPGIGKTSRRLAMAFPFERPLVLRIRNRTIWKLQAFHSAASGGPMRCCEASSRPLPLRMWPYLSLQ
jgi:hypothetical protein